MNHPLARSESARADYGQYAGTRLYPHDIVASFRGTPLIEVSQGELESMLSIIAAWRRYCLAQEREAKRRKNGDDNR
jgi:hypothetical protein